MATAIGAHLSPEEFQWRMEELASQASLEKIYAAEAAIEANLEADYLYAEYTVMKEGGDINDLAELYMEAEQAATENKVGLFRKIINWITRNVSRFMNWIGGLFGGGTVDPGQRAVVNEYDRNTGNLIIDKFKQIKDAIDKFITALEQKTGIDLKDVLGILTSCGLGFLAGSKFEAHKKKNDKGVTIEITGADVNTMRQRLDPILKWINKTVKRLQNIVEKYKGNVAQNKENFKKKNEQRQATAQATPNQPEAKPTENAGTNTGSETAESVSLDASVSVDDLFGYITERESTDVQAKRMKAGKAPASGNKTAVAVDRSKESTPTTGNAPAAQAQNNSGTGNNNQPTTNNNAQNTGTQTQPTSGSTAGQNTGTQTQTASGTTTGQTTGSQTSTNSNSNAQQTGNNNTSTSDSSTGTTSGSSSETPADDKKEKEITAAQTAASYALAIVQTLRDVVVGIMKSFRSVLSSFGNKVKATKSEKNAEKAQQNENPDQEQNEDQNDENPDDENTEEPTKKEKKKKRKIFGRKKNKKNKGEESGEQPTNQEQTEGQTQESTRELFGIDESEFDYLIEMTEEEEAEIAYLAENL